MTEPTATERQAAAFLQGRKTSPPKVVSDTAELDAAEKKLEALLADQSTLTGPTSAATAVQAARIRLAQSKSRAGG